jgi:hypothetical protein
VVVRFFSAFGYAVKKDTSTTPTISREFLLLADEVIE